jgi:hypothetical protein
MGLWYSIVHNASHSQVEAFYVLHSIAFLRFFAWSGFQRRSGDGNHTAAVRAWIFIAVESDSRIRWSSLIFAIISYDPLFFPTSTRSIVNVAM